MNRSLLALVCLLAGCGTSPGIEEGRWSGVLTPMNHPDMANPVAYDVRHEGGLLAIDLIGPGGEGVATHNPRLEGDTLFFAFHEPEEQVRLECALGPDSMRGFAGRCVDASGQWARFTMEPPE